MLQFFLLVLSSLSYYTPYDCPKDTECPAATNNKLTVSTYTSLCNCKNYANVEITISYNPVPSNLLNGATVGDVVFTTDITEISSNAFANSIVKKIDLSTASSSVTIGDSAFYSAQIDELILPAIVSSSESALAFSYCQIKKLDLSNFGSSDIDSLFYSATIDQISDVKANADKSVSFGIFKLCHIKTLSFKDFTDVEKIGDNAFKDVTIDEITSFGNVKTIGANAFQGSTINNINFGTSSLEEISSEAFESATITPTEQTFPETLETIGSSAFQKTGLKSIAFSPKNDNLEIGSSAFKGLNSLVKATIHAKTIKDNAFSECINLVVTESITIAPSGSIEHDAFKNCYQLNCKLTIADPSSSHSTIYYSAFENSGITSISLPKMNQIQYNAFKNCTQLTGGGTLDVDNIGSNAFEGDEKLVLTSITADTISSEAFKDCRKLGASIKINIRYNSNTPISVIGSSAFESCDELKNLTLVEPSYVKDDPTVEKKTIDPYTISIGSKAFYKSGLQGSLVIPYTLVLINDYAFAYCSKLTDVKIEGTYHLKKEIKEYAFYHSSIAGPLYLPNTVNAVESHAFSFTDITELTVYGSNRHTQASESICIKYDYMKDDSGNLIFDEDNQPIEICTEYTTVDTSWTATKIFDNAFYECRKLTKINLTGNDIKFDATSFRECPIEDLSITSNIIEIPSGAFYGMNSLASDIEIPDSVETIGYSAFEGCSNLKSVTFGENSKLNYIGGRAFYGCTNLKSTNIPNEVEDLYDYTYYRCSNLGSITLPPNLKSIKKYVFYECGNLDCTLTIPDELEEIGEKAFYRCSKLKGPLEFQDSTKTIGNKAFYDCSSLSNDLTFGRKIESIGEEAFRGSTFTGKLKFPDYLYNENGGILSIGKRAFYECQFTNTLELPQKVNFAGEEAFRGCKGFNGELVIPESSSFDGNAINTFRDCSGFTSLTIKDLQSIPEGTFQDCIGLTSEIPLDTVTSIGSNAFSGCSGLTGPLHLKGSSVENYAFYNCIGLNGDLICDQPLTSIGKYAFWGCSGLTGQLDCTAMTSVGRYAFYGCSGLTGPVNFTTSIKNIDEYAFARCTGLSNTLTFKVSNLKIRYGAFEECSGFKDGTLRFIMDINQEEEEGSYYYTYPYFLSIDTDAFLDTKFKNIYYLGRFAPDCGYDSGLSKAKNIYTSANYANKTFCGKTAKGKGGLSGGAIAGIVIAVIVVVAVIVFLVIYFLKKKGKDNSEGEVEMNNEP